MSGERTKTLGVCLVAIACGLAACGGEATRSVLEEACSGRGRIARVGRAEPPRCEGSELVAPSPELARALEGESLEAVREAMRAASVRALYVDLDAQGTGERVRDRLARGERTDAFRTRVLTRTALLVEPYDWPTPSEVEAWALARVAREVLAGTPPPALQQFPAALRAPRTVEIMVLLRSASGQALLWRSARSGSVASALLLALGVARSRWAERSSVLEGSLEDRIAALDVEVWLLGEDGTYAERSRSLVDQTLREDHGPGFETNNAWQYTLPEHLRARGVAAFTQLFGEQHLGADAFDRSDLRLYRVVALRLGVSRPGTRTSTRPAPPSRPIAPPPTALDQGEPSSL